MIGTYQKHKLQLLKAGARHKNTIAAQQVYRFEEPIIFHHFGLLISYHYVFLYVLSNNTHTHTHTNKGTYPPTHRAKKEEVSKERAHVLVDERRGGGRGRKEGRKQGERRREREEKNEKEDRAIERERERNYNRI